MKKYIIGNGINMTLEEFWDREIQIKLQKCYRIYQKCNKVRINEEILLENNNFSIMAEV